MIAQSYEKDDDFLDAFDLKPDDDEDNWDNYDNKNKEHQLPGDPYRQVKNSKQNN